MSDVGTQLYSPGPGNGGPVTCAMVSFLLHFLYSFFNFCNMAGFNDAFLRVGELYINFICEEIVKLP